MSYQTSWPEASALRCPACARVVPLIGIRPDLTLMFRCPLHAYFGSNGWTREPTWIDPHVDRPWLTSAPTRAAFVVAALSLFLRSAVTDDHLILQSPVPDNYVQFRAGRGGDGAIVGEVSSRMWSCPRCEIMPLGRSAENLLFEMGFDPCIPGESNYRCDQLPFDAQALGTIAETAFRGAFGEPADFGTCAIFSRPSMAEDFYLTWSFIADATEW